MMGTSVLRLTLLLAATCALAAVEHPFILWNPEEAAAIRKRIETEPSAAERWAEMQKESGRGGTLRNLFRFTVMGDTKAGEAEKKYLLKIVGTHPRNFEKLEHGGRHYDCYLDALRYDTLHTLLTPEERSAIEATFREYIAYQLTDTKEYTRTSWLPNMQWPRVMSAHLMAAAMRDETLIRALASGNGGWTWYLDNYMTAEGFYMEEFGKQYSMIGEMLLFCRALDRLGLGKMGYGYQGTGGGSMRAYLRSILLAGYPRTEIPGGQAQIARITMGDARGSGLEGAPPYLFQHAIVTGFLRNGKGGDAAWGGANMNGRDHQNAKVDKLMGPQWFEIASVQWPQDGWRWVLHQMRAPGKPSYVPSLYWGASPTDGSEVAPDARSWASSERGLALLRAEEGPAYWSSTAPTVALQFALYYVHYTHDALSLLGFHAFNRSIYLNRGVADGYAAGDPWTDSVRGHCGLVVDNLQASPLGQIPVRSLFAPAVKMIAVTDSPQVSGGRIRDSDNAEIAHSRTIYPDAVQTRALALTREYLLDALRVHSPRERRYQWQVHAIGQRRLSGGWESSSDLDGGTLYRGAPPQLEAKALSDPGRYDLQHVQKLTVGDGWSAEVVQGCLLPDPSTSVMGPEWFQRGIGVRVSLLGETGTTVYIGDTARYVRTGNAEPSKSERSKLPDEVGGTTILVDRRCAETAFVALHEPFTNGSPRLDAPRRIAQDSRGIAVAVRGAGGTVDDRWVVRLDERPSEVLELSGDGESFAVLGEGWLRIGADRVEAAGGWKSLSIRVQGSPVLILNGKLQDTQIRDGLLRWQTN